MTKQDLYNTVIEAKEKGDGKKIIAFYESMGFKGGEAYFGDSTDSLYGGSGDGYIFMSDVVNILPIKILDFSIMLQNGNEGINYDLEDDTPFEKEEVNRKDIPVFSGVLKYFPDALKEVAKASLAGQKQHNPDKPLAWDRSKSGNEYDCLSRHLIDATIEDYDTDGVLHLAKVAWRALAGLQKHLENNKQ